MIDFLIEVKCIKKSTCFQFENGLKINKKLPNPKTRQFSKKKHESIDRLIGFHFN